MKFLLELRFWNGLRRAATASEIFPWFQILWAEKFEDFEDECAEIGGIDRIFSPTLDITSTKVVSSLPWEHSRNTGKRKSRSVLKDFHSIVDNGADIKSTYAKVRFDSHMTSP